MSVDLPTPGSPPMSSAEPGTKPPPATRSNSAVPVMRRGGSLSTVFRSSNAILRPRLRGPALLPSGRAVSSSVIVFQPPHASHLPAHLDVTFPHDWQTKVEEDLAMIRL